MAAYRSLLGTDRPTALGNFLQPMAEGFAEGVDEDRIRRRNLADKVTGYESLIQPQLKLYRGQQEIHREMQGQAEDAALRKALMLEAYKRQSDPKMQATQQLSDMLKNPETTNVPWSGDFGHEGPTPVGGTPTTLPIDRRKAAGLAIQAGMRGKDWEAFLAQLEPGPQTAPQPKAADIYMDRDPMTGTIQRVNKITGEVSDVPGASNVGAEWDEYTVPTTGERMRYNKRTGERTSVGAAVREGPPYSEAIDRLNAVSDKFPDWKPGMRPSAAHSKAAIDYAKVQIPAERTEENVRRKLQTEAAMAESIRKVAYARAAGQAGGRFDASLPLSPSQNQAFGTPQGTTWKDVMGTFGPGQKARLAVEELRVSENLANTLSSLADKLIVADNWVQSNMQGAQLTAGAWSRANEDAAVFADQREALLGVLSRQVGAERGVLTDRDIYRIDKMLPNFRDTKSIKDKKLAFLRSMISANRDARIKSISSLLDSSTENAWEASASGGKAPAAGQPNVDLRKKYGY